MACEDVNEAFREADDLVQLGNDGFSVKKLALAERYLKGEMEFGLILVTNCMNSLIRNEFVAIFERKFPIRRGSDPHRGRIGRQIRPAHDGLYSELLVSRGYGDEQLMFVGDVNAVQTPEGVVPSTVRLQPSNEFYRICGRTVDPADGAAVKVDLIRTYWERSVVAGRPAVSPKSTH